MNPVKIQSQVIEFGTLISEQADSSSFTPEIQIAWTPPSAYPSNSAWCFIIRVSLTCNGSWSAIDISLDALAG